MLQVGQISSLEYA